MIYVQDDLTKQTFAFNTEAECIQGTRIPAVRMVFRSMFNIFNDHDLLRDDLRQEVLNSRASYRIREMRYKQLLVGNVILDKNNKDVLQEGQSIVTILFKASLGSGQYQYSFSNKEFPKC